MLHTDTIYATSDGGAFYSPDGIGRVFYETEEECIIDTGLHDYFHASKWEESIDFNPYLTLREAEAAFPRHFRDDYTSYEDYMAEHGLSPDGDINEVMA